MKIGLLHFRTGFTDGVSLEMDKWKKVLEKLGHEVFYVAGESPNPDTFIIEELSINSNKHKMMFQNCYVKLTDFNDETSLKDEILKDSLIIEKKLLEFINKNNIDLLMPNNIASLGLHVAGAIALSNIITNTNIKVIYHHHDFYWERERYSNPTTNFVKDTLFKYFPFHNENTKHVVINKIAQKELLIRKGIDSYVIPNVFDFNQKPWVIDDFNNDLRSNLNIKENDIVFLQATRIEDRKAIELALDLVNEVYLNKDKLIDKKLYNGQIFTNKSKIHFIMAGLNEITELKYQILLNKIKQMPYEIHVISDIVKMKRQLEPKCYSLWDIYTMADIVTYPSILEGWGNQLIEAIFANKPVIVYEYPVYLTDIKNLGFNIISLGNEHIVNNDGLATINKDILKDAAYETINCLTDELLYKNITKTNNMIAAKKLSYESLEKHLQFVISTI